MEGAGDAQRLDSIYAREPLRREGDIPVFSADDAYTDNYRAVSSRHMESVAETGANPDMPEEFWAEAEETTRALLRRWVEPGSRILDVGVGLGRLLGPMREYERYGVDISMAYLEQAKAAGIEVCFSKADEMPYAPGTFDAVVSTDVLEHVLDLNRSVQCMLDVLKPGGVMIVRVPYREWLGLYAASEYPFQFAHIRNFDEFSLTLFFTRVMGCEVLEWTPGGHMLVYELFKYRVPKITYSIVDFIAWLGKVSPSLYRRVVVRAFHPVEINFVVRKRPG